MKQARQPNAAELDIRLLAGRAYNEDAAVLKMPQGKALVQTADILAPIVNDARSFGRIAAANAMSDVYAMGGEPWCAMCLGFFPACAAEEDPDVFVNIIEGALTAMSEAGAVLAGGHTVQDDELKFGLSVSGLIEPDKIARNDALRPGQRLILTKALGVGILATGVKAHWDYAAESEAEISRCCGKLNKAGAEAIRTLGISAATDVTGFGLGGHVLEMARASGVTVELFASRLPLLPHVLDYAMDGLIPVGTHANEAFFAPHTICAGQIDKALLSVVFDAQTSGGLLLAVTDEQIEKCRQILLANDDLAVEIGCVQQARTDGKLLVIRP